MKQHQTFEKIHCGGAPSFAKFLLWRGDKCDRRDETMMTLMTTVATLHLVARTMNPVISCGHVAAVAAAGLDLMNTLDARGLVRCHQSIVPSFPPSNTQVSAGRTNSG
jgi:hypothetical protein